MSKITIEQGLSAARAIRQEWPTSTVRIDLTLGPLDRDCWEGDQVFGPIHVVASDRETRASILARMEDAHWHCPLPNVNAVAFAGTLAGLDAYLEVPAVAVTFDEDVTYQPDDAPVTVGVDVVAVCVMELDPPRCRITRLLDCETGRDLLDDVRGYAKAQGDACRPYSRAGTQIADLEAAAVIVARESAAVKA